MLSFVEKIKLKNSSLVMEYNGVSESGIRFLALILCDEVGVRLLKQDYANNSARRVFEYGEVLFLDFSENPKEKAQAFLSNWCIENGGSLLS